MSFNQLQEKDSRRSPLLLLLILGLAGSVGLVGCSGLTSSTTRSPKTGAAISVVPSNISFGNLAIGDTNTQMVSLSNTGSADLTISQASVTGMGFSLSGLSVPLRIPAGQSSTFTVAFAPAAADSMTGNISLLSNASNSPTTGIQMSGTGVTSGAHSVTLNWDHSTSTIVGYYVYRATQSGGPYAKLNTTPVTSTTFTDSAVASGLNYLYVVTSVDFTNVESLFSNEVQATIPTP